MLSGIRRTLAVLRIAIAIGILTTISPSHAFADQTPISLSVAPICSDSSRFMCDTKSCSVTKSDVLENGLTPLTPAIASARITQEEIAEQAMVTPSLEATPSTPPSIETTSTPTQAQAASLSSDVVFNLINEHRASIGLPVFEKDPKLCEIAVSRGPEMPGEIQNGTLHSGLYARNLPYWITENMKYGGDEKETVRWWLNSPVHRAAIEGDYKYSCGFCVGDTCNELFTNYSPK